MFVETRGTRKFRQTRAGYNWMSGKLAARYLQYFIDDRFRRFDVAEKEIGVLERFRETFVQLVLIA